MIFIKWSKTTSKMPSPKNYLTKAFKCGIISHSVGHVTSGLVPLVKANGSLAQSVEQRTFNPLVESSSLSRPTTIRKCWRFGSVAQLVEQRTLNPSVQSSSLCAPTIAIFSPTPFQLSLLLVCFLIFLRNNLKISVQFRSFLSKKQHLTLQ